ncbi:MAG TPA: UBP-type zinc finger domain-containing protein [Candidatus Limnocylindrales bacterium]|nr:UBP-type zinc finger domain-containing protein [Candidatus Limnocylindrales bacterium]
MSRLGDALRTLTGQGGPSCSHLDQARNVEPRSDGCEECLATGSQWVHLRLCLACGHVGCCDQSPNRHARAHFTETGHAIIRSHEPDDTWAWCWIDEIEV